METVEDQSKDVARWQLEFTKMQRRAKAAETLDPTAFRDLRDERDESLLLIEECESNLKGVETTLSEKMSEIERLNEALAVERKAREEAGWLGGRGATILLTLQSGGPRVPYQPADDEDREGRR